MDKVFRRRPRQSASRSAAGRLHGEPFNGPYPRAIREVNASGRSPCEVRFSAIDHVVLTIASIDPVVASQPTEVVGAVRAVMTFALLCMRAVLVLPAQQVLLESAGLPSLAFLRVLRGFRREHRAQA